MQTQFYSTLSYLRLKVSLFVIIFCAVILLSGSFYYIFTLLTKNLKKDVDATLTYAEAAVNSGISNAKHVIYGIAASLSSESLISNNSHIEQLIYNFSARSGPDRSIPLAGLVLLDHNGKMIVNTIKPDLLSRLQTSSHPLCLSEATGRFFELSISPIRRGMHFKELIAPLNMKIANLRGQLIGVLCTGLIIRELEDKVNLRYAYKKGYGSIKLQNKQSHLINNINDSFTLSSMLTHYLNDQTITIFKPLRDHPFAIKLRLHPEYLSNSLGAVVVTYMVCITIFIICTYLIWLIVSHYFHNSLHHTHHKLSLLNVAINQKFQDLPITFNPEQFAKEINELIDNYYSLQISKIDHKEQEIQRKLLNLVLVEQHFLLNSSDTITPEEKLYHNKLLNLINEEPTSLSLSVFLQQVSDYCCEFYHDLHVKIIVQQADQKAFYFKHAALAEAIFHIFSFINRGKFDTDENKIILTGSFATDNDFPTIVIEAHIPENSTIALGWASGPSYVYNSLLSIYLLARENKLFFNIAQKDDNMLFILEPNNEKMQFYNQVLNIDEKSSS